MKEKEKKKERNRERERTFSVCQEIFFVLLQQPKMPCGKPFAAIME